MAQQRRWVVWESLSEQAEVAACSACTRWLMRLHWWPSKAFRPPSLSVSIWLFQKNWIELNLASCLTCLPFPYNWLTRKHPLTFNWSHTDRIHNDILHLLILILHPCEQPYGGAMRCRIWDVCSINYPSLTLTARTAQDRFYSNFLSSHVPLTVLFLIFL